jgi:hypothetical protein
MSCLVVVRVARESRNVLLTRISIERLGALSRADAQQETRDTANRHLSFIVNYDETLEQLWGQYVTEKHGR